MFIDKRCDQTENEVKEQKGAFIGMLLAILGASLVKNMLAGTGVIWVGKETNRAGQVFNVASSFN